MLAPATPAELAAVLQEAAARGNAISLAGHSSKCLMAGPVMGIPCTATIVTQSADGYSAQDPLPA